MKTYRINDGHSFRLSDTEVRHGGELIELEDDVAYAHADKLTFVPTEDETDEAQGNAAEPEQGSGGDQSDPEQGGGGDQSPAIE